MSILGSLPLGKIIGAGFAGMVIASPFAIKHLSNYSSSNEEQEEAEKGEANCWLVMQGTDQQETEKEKQLIVCKDSTEGSEDAREEESQTPKAKYYLRYPKNNETRKEVESIAIKDQNVVTLTLVKNETDSSQEAKNKQEVIQITQFWNLGDSLTFNSDCQIQWQEVNENRKKLTCTPTRSSGKYKWLDPIYD